MEALINGAWIHYRRSGAGFPLLMLHAGVADSRQWEPQAADFGGHFDVIRPDMRGFGQSELPPVPWAPHADVIGLMNELGLMQAHLVGCSMGGAIAIDLALEHPDRLTKLVLVGAGVGGAKFGEKYPDLFAAVEAADEKGDLEAVNEAEARLWLDGPRRPQGHVGKPLRDLFLDMNGTSLHSAFDKAPRQGLQPPAMNRLEEIGVPTLVIVGDEDVPPVMETADLFMSTIRGARKAIIHDAAHLPNLEHTDEFNRLVLDFLLESPKS
jgi:pimeloyl-ACP methyl ester carboxylesterase